MYYHKTLVDFERVRQGIVDFHQSASFYHEYTANFVIFILFVYVYLAFENFFSK